MAGSDFQAGEIVVATDEMFDRDAGDLLLANAGERLVVANVFSSEAKGGQFAVAVCPEARSGPCFICGLDKVRRA